MHQDKRCHCDSLPQRPSKSILLILTTWASSGYPVEMCSPFDGLPVLSLATDSVSSHLRAFLYGLSEYYSETHGGLIALAPISQPDTPTVRGLSARHSPEGRPRAWHPWAGDMAFP